MFISFIFKNYDADVAEKLNNFLEKLDDLKTLKTPFHVVSVSINVKI